MGWTPLGKSQFLKRRSSMLGGLAVGAVVAVVYLGTLAPTVLYYDIPGLFDAPMLQAEVAVLGVGHPTGYPLYIMLTHLFTYLPVGDEAYRVNLASAVYGVAAVLLVYAVGLRFTGRVVAAACGALSLAFCGTFWSEAVIAEVYTLDVVFLAVITLLLLRWRAGEPRSDRLLLLVAFLCGLSLTHHLTSALLVPGALLFVYLVDRDRAKDLRLMLRAAALFALGLLPYIYLPIRALMNAPMNESDPSTLGRFLLLITGGSYAIEPPEGKMACNPSVLATESWWTRAQLFGEDLAGQFPWLLVAVGLLGIVYLLRTDRALSMLLGLIFVGSVGHVLLYLGYGVEDFYVFMIPAYFVFALSIAAGVASCLRYAGQRSNVSPRWRRYGVVLVGVVALATPLLGARLDYAGQDYSGDYRGRRIIEAVARNADEGATVLHHRSSLWYMVLVEERRRDLTLVDPFCTSWVRYNDVVWPEDIGARAAVDKYKTADPEGVAAAREALKSGSVYILGQEFEQQRVDLEVYEEAGFELVPIEGGVLYEIVPEGRDQPAGD
jgi:4-amino-4-deoxy-L-arabinose transferase-like glycosyltransferase